MTLPAAEDENSRLAEESTSIEDIDLSGTEKAPPSMRLLPRSLRRRLVAAAQAIARMLGRGGAFDAMALDRHDPEVIAALGEVFDWLNHRYFRLHVEGLEHVSPTGGQLFVANHNGGIMGPDLSCTLGTLWNHLEVPLFCMAHDFAMRRVTVLGRVLQSVGAMRAHPDNALRVLRAGQPVLVYPGGDLDAYRLSRLRNHVVFGPRTGFVRVARDAGAPIVPVVAHGAHRSAWIFHEGRFLARWLRLDRWSRIQRFPLAFALPWGIAAGPWVPYLPLPFPIRLRFLPPIWVGTDEPLEVARDRVTSAMQQALDAMALRRSP